ncbi:MAG: ABC transporter ATP-binding protein [Gammaproteobacteria bacterium]|nr:ABC transporter ATP-binding protein [Gammaproteobacteria bacterium]
MSEGEQQRRRFSLRTLREDEKALDTRASLADLETDIDYRRTFRLIGRSVLFVRYVWLRYVISFASHWLRENLAIVLAPWIGKILIDHVVLGVPVEDVSGYPSFLLPVVEMLEGASVGPILFWVVLFSVAGLVAGLAHGYVMALFDTRLNQSVVHLVRCRLFGSVQALPMTKLDDQPIGDSVYRVVNDTGVIPDVITTVLIQPVSAVSAFAVALVTLLSAYPDSPAVAVFAVGALPMYLFVIVPFSRMLRRRSQAVIAAQSAFTSNIEEGMDNMLAVQALGAKKTERERFRKDSAETFKRIRFNGLAFDVVGTFLEIATQLLVWGFTVYVVAQVIFGDFSPGDFVVVVGYFALMREPAQKLAYLWIGLQGDAARARRVFAMLEAPPETETGRYALPPVEGGVSFRQVGFVYPDGRRALRDVTLDAGMGQIVAIVGPTGAGKTTLAYLIPRYHAASEGQVLIDGHDVTDATLESLRGQTSYVFQETQTVNESILENIRLGKPDASRQLVEGAARTAGIHDFIVSMPDGYDTKLGTSTSKLSVGQKQRIGIARGLLKDSRILILDEPTSALDPETEAYLVNALQEAARNRIVIIIAHRLSTVALADQVVFLDDGRVLEQGTHAELMAREDGNYRRFVELQTESAV